MSEQHSLTLLDRQTLLRALASGAVTPQGVQFIRSGRSEEIRTFERELDSLSRGFVKFLVGPSGVGKTFLADLVCDSARTNRCITLRASLSQRHRLHGSSGEARALYGALMAGVSSRSHTNGGAFPALLDGFITRCQIEAEEKSVRVERALEQRLAPLTELPRGFDYIEAMKIYAKGRASRNQNLVAGALRWLTADNPATSPRIPGIGRSISDAEIFDLLKLFGRFTSAAGHAGTLVILDHLEGIANLQHPTSRGQNWDQVLALVESSSRGDLAGMGFVFLGTPEAIDHGSRGLLSNPALQARFGQPSPLPGEMKDWGGPILRLGGLSDQETVELLNRVHAVFAAQAKVDVPREVMAAFLGSGLIAGQARR